MFNHAESLQQILGRKVTARIPHQSRYARQLPPGGSLWGVGYKFEVL